MEKLENSHHKTNVKAHYHIDAQWKTKEQY